MLDQLAHLIGKVLALGETASSSLTRVLTIVSTLLLGWAAYRLVLGLIHRLLGPLEGAPDPARAQRARTLQPLLASVTRYLVTFIAALVVLQELGIDVRALMVSAGVVGLAVGFGAQGLIKDVIAGLFILFENLLSVGDVIEVGPHTGIVEAVGLRVTKLRKFTGELRIVPNGELAAFGHHSAGWLRIVVEVGIAWDQDVTRALGVLETVGRALQEAHGPKVLEPPTAEGIIRFGDSAVVLRLHVRVDAGEKSALELELRRRVKEALDTAGVRSPQPELVVHLAGGRTALPDTSNRKESLA